jgi:hypothetical protein
VLSPGLTRKAQGRGRRKDLRECTLRTHLQPAPPQASHSRASTVAVAAVACRPSTPPLRHPRRWRPPPAPIDAANPFDGSCLADRADGRKRQHCSTTSQHRHAQTTALEHCLDDRPATNHQDRHGSLPCDALGLVSITLPARPLPPPSSRGREPQRTTASMGICMSTSNDDVEQKKRSQAIDRKLEEDSRRLRRECKILLLGKPSADERGHATPEPQSQRHRANANAPQAPARAASRPLSSR